MCSNFVRIEYRIVKLLADARMGDARDGKRTIRVYYIRHGQSIWNQEQQEARAKGASLGELEEMGQEHRFTDSPLSRVGIEQALELRHHLFPEKVRHGAWPIHHEQPHHEKWIKRPDSLGLHLRCAKSGHCLPPRLLVSNLRRAVATMLLALRPAIEANTYKETGVLVVPALQDSCQHADCAPMPRYKHDKMIEALPSHKSRLTVQHMLKGVDPAEHDVVAKLLYAEAQEFYDAVLEEHKLTPPPTLEEQVEMHLEQEMDYVYRAYRIGRHFLGLPNPPPPPPMGEFAHSSFVRRSYQSHVRIAPHDTYDDRRRVPAGTLANDSLASALEKTEQLQPFMRRVEDILYSIFDETSVKPEMSAAFAEAAGSNTVVITAHSRLLRELLFVFRTRQVATYAKFSSLATKAPTALGWGDDNNEACDALSTEEFKLSNTGGVKFDLDLCEQPACNAPTLTLNGCKLEAGGHVHPRNGGEPTHLHLYEPVPFANLIDGVAALIAVFPFVLPFLCCFMAYAKRRHQRKPETKRA